MNPQDAINELGELCVTNCSRPSQRKCSYCGVTTAMEALEKQTPFKPKTEKLVAGVGRCKCGVEFLDRATKYCGNCGQRLDWSEE